MKIEDYNKKPNFLLIVLLAAGAMLVIFAVALFVLHSDRHLEPKAQPAAAHASLRLSAGYDAA